ncbi:glycerol uptake protein [Lotmaria passim]
MKSRIPFTLSLGNFVSRSADDNSASASTNVNQTRGNANSVFVELSPFCGQSARDFNAGGGRSNGTPPSSGCGRRGGRAASTSDADVTILSPMLRQGSLSPSHSSPIGLGVSARTSGHGPSLNCIPAFQEAPTEVKEDGVKEKETRDLVGRSCLSPSRRSSLTPTGTLPEAAESSYVPPRWYHLERLVYLGCFVGFLIRSYYVGYIFFRANMPQLRRGVGQPNRLLAALLPTIGYDGGLDQQWISFLHSQPSLFLVAAGLGVASRVFRCSARAQPLAGRPPAPARSSNGVESSTPSTSLSFLSKLATRARHAAQLQTCIYVVVGVIFVAVVHGPHFFMPLLLTLANYVVFTRLQRWCPYWLFMTIMWAAHISLLYIIEASKGFEHTYLLQLLLPSSEEASLAALGYARKPLWRQRMRWYVAFRMTTLRLIAFNYDLWEATHCAARARERAADKHDTTCIECAQLREQNSSSSGGTALPAEASRCYKYRTECPRDLGDYNFLNYLAYVVFPPLYLAGPMSSFNAFVSYMRVPSTAMPARKMAVYACRTGALFLVAYFHLHFWFIIALSERVDLLYNASPEFQSYILYYYLAYLWLKFNFIWKSSRLFAMFSGIEVPEDMRRCFSNTTTVRNFWRDWHASFNLWIVRYMYVPMGGRSRVALSILPIFLFIALWHDPALHLLKWALCIAAMFVVELVVSACFGWVAGVFHREVAAASSTGGAGEIGFNRWCIQPLALWPLRHLTPFQRGTIHRELVTMGCFFSVFGLIVANMVGFCVQNTAADVKEFSATDALIWRALRTAHARYYMGLFSILYSASGIGVSMWFWEDVTAQELRCKHRLKAKTAA